MNDLLLLNGKPLLIRGDPTNKIIIPLWSVMDEQTMSAGYPADRQEQLLA